MGSPTNPNGRLLVTSSITKIGTNQYRLHVSLGVKNSLTWNEYGINCYAHIGNQKIHLGTFKIPENTGVCRPNSYTRDFTITTNTVVYASCVCVHCNGSQDGWIGTSNPDTVVYTNPNSAPPTPVIKCLNYAAPSKYLVEKTLDVELSEVRDPDGDTVRYVIYAQYKTPGSNTWLSAGDGNNCILWTPDRRTASVNIENHPRGTQYRIWGKAEDVNHGLSSPETGKIENIYRRQALTTPTLRCVEKQFNGNYIVEETLSVALSNSTDPENIGSPIDHFICGKYKPPGRDWISMGNNDIIANGLSANIRIDGYERGTQFKLWGYATEKHLNSRSANSNEISNIFRNREPNPVATINPASQIIIGNSMTITWTPSSDPDGQPVNYSVWLKVNDGHYNSIVSGIKGTEFEMDVSSYNPGTEFTFKVMPNDGMINGDPTFSPVYKKDFPPSFILPINNSTLYQESPRLIAKIMKGSGVHLHVSHDNISFNSNNNADRFRRNIKALSDGESMCFNPVLGVNKTNNITIYNTHNGFESSRVSLAININSLSVDLSGSIKKSINDSLIEAINNISRAYNQQSISSNIIIGETVIIKSHINQMTNSLNNVRNVVNEYDTNKINTSWNNNSDNIIRRTDFQQILDGISNV